jgi:hypothetical protein
MTAVYKKNEKRHDRKITPANSAPGRIDDTILEKAPDREKQILALGFMYFLATIQRKTLLR